MKIRRNARRPGRFSQRYPLQGAGWGGQTLSGLNVHHRHEQCGCPRTPAGRLFPLVCNLVDIALSFISGFALVNSGKNKAPTGGYPFECRSCFWRNE